MNLIEATKLCRIIASLIPKQRFDDETPAMWSVPLADVALGDAQSAVRRLIRRQPYIGADDIIQEVRSLRAERVREAEHGDRLVPNVDPDDPRAWTAELRALRQAAADGHLDADAYAQGGFTLTGATPLQALEAGQ